jgi:hypothetical protein
MKKKIGLKTTTSRKTKAKRLAALENLRERLLLLVALQKNAIERIQHSDHVAILLIQKRRLLIYDRFMQLLVCSFEDLQKELSKKQPGGAPRNPHRDLAFNILTEHYIQTEKVLTAKNLSRQVIERLPSEQRIEERLDPFSLRIAAEVIKEFKILLRTSPIDWN